MRLQHFKRVLERDVALWVMAGWRQLDRDYSPSVGNVWLMVWEGEDAPVVVDEAEGEL